MAHLPHGSRAHRGGAPAYRTRRRRRRYSPDYARARRRRRLYKRIIDGGLVAIVAGSVGFALAQSPWPVTTTLRHFFASQNCGAASLVGLAPAHRGEPGYWSSNDGDNDGVACERY